MTTAVVLSNGDTCCPACVQECRGCDRTFAGSNHDDDEVPLCFTCGQVVQRLTDAADRAADKFTAQREDYENNQMRMRKGC